MKKLFFVLWTILYATMFYAQPRMRHLTVSDGLPNNEVRQILELPNGQLLVATEGYFSLYTGDRFVAVKCDLDSVQHLPAFGGHSFLWQGDSLLWIKDYYHLYLFDTRCRSFRYDYQRHATTRILDDFIGENSDTLAERHRRILAPYVQQLRSITAAADYAAESLQTYAQDRQGGKWFGLRDAGILYLPPVQETIQCTDLGVDDVPRHMVPIDSERMLVAGAKGIYEFNPHDTGATRTLLREDIHTTEACADRQGRIWITTNLGIFCYDHGTLQRYDTSNVAGFNHPFIRFAVPVDRQRLLVCNYMHDLGYFYPDELHFELLNTRLPQLDSYRTMIVATPMANRNHLAVCTQNGFFILDTAADTLVRMPELRNYEHYSNKYNCVLHDRVGRLWIGTQNGLLLRTNGQMRRISRADGLHNECIQSLVEDAAGNVWVGTANGISRIATANGDQDIRIRTLTADEGLPEAQLIERGVCIMPDSSIYMATDTGMLTFRTGCFQQLMTTPRVELVGLTVAEQNMPLDAHTLHLNYRQNYINLQVSTLDYAHPHSARYRYRILELNDGWQATPEEDSQRTSIRLTALAPGRYTVEVQASAGDNLWGETLRKTFIISPPLWLTWWAKLLYTLAALTITVLALRWYLRDRQQRMQRDNERRINEIFELREEALHKFVQSVEIDPQRLAANTHDQQLIQRITHIIGDNLDNADFTVDQLALEVGMSRSNLYKKMQDTIGITPNDFIRDVRLRRAAELLAKSNMPINQLSLKVGFQTPRYFSQCFQKMFGVTPTEYREGATATKKRRESLPE